MRHILTSVVLLVLLLPSLAFNTFAKGERYSDDDWNLTFYDNCGMPTGGSVRWIEEENNKFIRFQLGDKDYGGCRSDRMRRHGAPYWERAELKQSSTLASNTKYELAFNVRFVEGFSGNRERFWQINAYNSPCRAKSPINIEISVGNLTLTALKESGEYRMFFSGIKISDLIGKWNNVKLNFDTTSSPKFSLYLNDKQVFLNVPFWVEACDKPHFKFGIYRPGNENGIKLSIIDFDKINVKKIK